MAGPSQRGNLEQFAEPGPLFGDKNQKMSGLSFLLPLKIQIAINEQWLKWDDNVWGLISIYYLSSGLQKADAQMECCLWLLCLGEGD